jgi:hypothetical protein
MNHSQEYLINERLFKAKIKSCLSKLLIILFLIKFVNTNKSMNLSLGHVESKQAKKSNLFLKIYSSSSPPKHSTGIGLEH